MSLPSVRGVRSCVLSLAAALLFVLTAACAQRPPDSAALFAEWLSEDDRTIGVGADEFDPILNFWTQESQAGHGALKGAGEGALAMVQGGALSGDPFGAALGVALAPVAAMVGAIVGAASADPIEISHPLSGLEGAEDLFQETLSDLNLAESLRAEIVRLAGKRTKHVLLSALADQEETYGALQAASLDGLMKIKIQIIGLAGKEGDNPRVALRIAAFAVAIYNGADQQISYSGAQWEYEGERRTLDDWAADDAALFRAEIPKALQGLADQIVEGVFFVRDRRLRGNSRQEL